MNNQDHISKSLETIFLVKILNFLMRIRDGKKYGFGKEKLRIRDRKNSDRGSEMEKIRTRDQHHGSATTLPATLKQHPIRTWLPAGEELRAAAEVLLILVIVLCRVVLSQPGSLAAVLIPPHSPARRQQLLVDVVVIHQRLVVQPAQSGTHHKYQT
jgi:hypothetical protein